MSRVSLSAKHARALLNLAEHFHWVGEPNAEAAAEALRAALAPRPKSSQRKRTESKRAAKRNALQAIREDLIRRADGICECGCGQPFGTPFYTQATVDHFFGRARSESVESCWLIRWDCHARKTDNRPSAEWWMEKFAIHARKHGYAAEAERAERESDWREAKKAGGAE